MALQEHKFAYNYVLSTVKQNKKNVIRQRSNPGGFWLSRAEAAWIGGKPSFKHDIRSFAQAGDVVGGHVAVRDVVGVEAQVLQVGVVGNCDELAETCQFELCKGIDNRGKNECPERSSLMVTLENKDATLNYTLECP